MNKLAKVLIFKIVGTIALWCVPMILFPIYILNLIGFPEQDSYMFIRLLGWAYLALCVGYYHAFKAALNGKRLMAPIWVGIISNGGGFMYLLLFGLSGVWSSWGVWIQVVAWGSVVATALITLGLYHYGVNGDEPKIE